MHCCATFTGRPFLYRIGTHRVSGLEYGRDSKTLGMTLLCINMGVCIVCSNTMLGRVHSVFEHYAWGQVETAAESQTLTVLEKPRLKSLLQTETSQVLDHHKKISGL